MNLKMIEHIHILKVKFLLLTLGAWLIGGALLQNKLYAQSWRRDIRKGNEFYSKKNYKDAEKKYKQAQEKKPDNFDANFNLADAYYKQKKYEQSAAIFNSLKDKTTDKDKLSSLYHNLGNTYLQDKKYQESIDAFKQSLKLKPQDKDTKYNLAYANAMLQKQKQQEQQKKQKGKDDKKDDNKGDNKQENKGEEKDNKTKNNDPKKGEEEKNKQQKPEEGKMSKEQAEQLLKAIQGKEKDVQDKLKAQKARGAKVKIEKDW